MLVGFLLGCLFMGVQLSIRSKLVKMGKAKIWPNCIMVLLANASVIFGITWAIESAMEHETQAAVLGMVTFGGIGVVFAVIAYRLINKKETQKVVKETAKEA